MSSYETHVSRFSLTLIVADLMNSSPTSGTAYSEKSGSITGSKTFPRQNILDTEFAVSPEVWTWGSNNHGQLGHGDFVTR